MPWPTEWGFTASSASYSLPKSAALHSDKRDLVGDVDGDGDRDGGDEDEGIEIESPNPKEGEGYGRAKSRAKRRVWAVGLKGGYMGRDMVEYDGWGG